MRQKLLAREPLITFLGSLLLAALILWTSGLFGAGLARIRLGPGASPREAGRSAAPESRPAGRQDSVQLVVAGLAQPVTADTELPLSADLAARVDVRQPDEQRYGREVDVYLYRKGASDLPVEDATIAAAGHMRFMDHGSFRQVALYRGEGHYLLPVQFLMAGEWALDLDIAAPGGQGVLRLDVDIYD